MTDPRQCDSDECHASGGDDARLVLCRVDNEDVTAILTKLGLRDRIQAVILACETGIATVGAWD